MEYTAAVEPAQSFFNWKLVLVGVVVGAIVCALVYFLVIRRDTTPKTPEGFQEGFGGATNGVGIRNSSESEALVGIFQEKVERDSADLAELTLLLKKMTAFQKDLMSPSRLVDATRNVDFATAHDREAVADTVARCFNKTIPQRDLEITLDTWKERGDALVKRLAVQANLSASEVQNVKDLFSRAWAECQNVARSQCLAGEPTIVGEFQPRQPREFSPGVLDTYGEYKEAPWS